MRFVRATRSATAFARDHATAREHVTMLEGAEVALTRMLAAMAGAKRSIYVEAVSLSVHGRGRRVTQALLDARRRGVAVHVTLMGVARDRGALVSELRTVGCVVHARGAVLALLGGHLGRHHRTLLLVDDSQLFLGDVHLGVVPPSDRTGGAWSALTLEIRGPWCGLWGAKLRGRPAHTITTALRIRLSETGGRRLERAYLHAIGSATDSIDLALGAAHFDGSLTRALASAARRGARVRLLVATLGDSLGPFHASRRHCRALLAAGVQVHAWSDAVLHSKIATVDGRLLIVGGFSLDPPASEALDTVVEAHGKELIAHATEWIDRKIDAARPVSSTDLESATTRWLLGPRAPWNAPITALRAR